MKKEVMCKSCGWAGSYDELLGRTVYEDFGDVYYAVCPSCKRTDVDNDMLIPTDPKESFDGTRGK